MDSNTLIPLTLLIIVILIIFYMEKFMKPTKTLILASIGHYYRSGKQDFVDLRQYYIDASNNLYSLNLDTWEINRREKKDLLLCSDFTLDKDGNIINTLRDMKRKKVTIQRKNLNFNTLAHRNGLISLEVVNRTSRHFTIIKDV